MHPFSGVVSSEKVWKLVCAITMLNSTISSPLTRIVSVINAFRPLPVRNCWRARIHGFISRRIPHNFNSGRQAPFSTLCASIILPSFHPNTNFFTCELFLVLMNGGQSFKKGRGTLLPRVLCRLLLALLTVALS